MAAEGDAQQQPESASTWYSLQAELVQHVASFMSRNEVACSLRPLCRSTAAALSSADYTTVRLSEWCPHHAFAWRWGAHGVLRGLSQNRQKELVRLTATSGSLQNLELAVACTGSYCLNVGVAAAAAVAGHLDVLNWLKVRRCDRLLTGDVMSAAAAGGHINVCAWLLEQFCPFAGDWESPLSLSPPLVEAAAVGRQDLCAWLLANGCQWTGQAVYDAAMGGHVTLMDWLLQQRPVAAAEQEGHGDEHEVHGGEAQGGQRGAVQRVGRHTGIRAGHLLRAVARGCPLPVLQRVHREWAEGPGGWRAQLQQREEQQQEWERQEDEDWGDWDQEGPQELRRMAPAAAISSTPDWADKVAWLQNEKGYPLTSVACTTAVELCATDEEALARLTWLRGRGCEADHRTLAMAAIRGRPASLRYLLAEGVLYNLGFMVMLNVARGGHLDCMQALHAAGIDVQPHVSILEAAASGSLPLVRWLVETPGLEADVGGEQMAAKAVESENLELLSYLRQRGCPVDRAVRGETWVHGSREVLDWLRDLDKPTQQQQQQQ